MLPISVIIPFYQDTQLLLGNLRKNKVYLSECEIIVVNDSPEIDIASQVKQLIPSATVVTNAKNLGFSLTVNAGVQRSTREFVFLLNMDVVLLDRSFTKSLAHFQTDPSLFAVSFAQKENNGMIVGANEGYFAKGMYYHRTKKSDTRCENLWPDGGSCVIRKKFFVELGGYDGIFSPFYWEDVDLGFRAKKMGWHTVFDPSILVEHHHETVIGSHFPKEQIKKIATRNQLLFVWKNIRGIRLLLHGITLPFILVSQRKNRYFMAGFKEALFRLIRKS